MPPVLVALYCESLSGGLGEQEVEALLLGISLAHPFS